MNPSEKLAERILHDMRDGVMSVDRTGNIVTFNQAAQSILGMDADELIGHSFAEAFFQSEGHDEFNQAILDAVYDNAVAQHQNVAFMRGEERRQLSLTTTLLHADNDGVGQASGVIAVFSDVTDLQQAQEAQARLTQALQAQHTELQQAFRQTEASNVQLAAAARKIRIERRMVAGFVLVLALLLGFYYAGSGQFARSLRGGDTAEPGKPTVQEWTVAPKAASASIHLVGRIAPLQTVNVNSPLGGRVERMLVQYGDVVVQGQTLLVLDTTEVLLKLRDAQAALIRANEKLGALADWDNSAEMARSRRSLAKARMSLDAQKRALDETERLRAQGIIPANEYESVKQQYASQLIDYQSAQEELSAAAAQGAGNPKQLARMEQASALVRVRQIESELAGAVVKAPVAGIVIRPASTGPIKGGKTASKGENFAQGEVMLAIGDLSGLAVTSKVDEVDVIKLKAGQVVTITGDAFQGLTLAGTIRAVSPQADEADARALPTFVIHVAVTTLSEAQRQRILVGMSANLDIVVYDNPQALMLPLAAVSLVDGQAFVQRKLPGPAGQPVQRETVPVRTGFTSLDEVEITQGLKPGDVILVGAEPGVAATPAAGPKG